MGTSSSACQCENAAVAASAGDPIPVFTPIIELENTCVLPHDVTMHDARAFLFAEQHVCQFINSTYFAVDPAATKLIHRCAWEAAGNDDGSLQFPKTRFTFTEVVPVAWFKTRVVIEAVQQESATPPPGVAHQLNYESRSQGSTKIWVRKRRQLTTDIATQCVRVTERIEIVCAGWLESTVKTAADDANQKHMGTYGAQTAAFAAKRTS
jgi:hypothetical protein